MPYKEIYSEPRGKQPIKKEWYAAGWLNGFFWELCRFNGGVAFWTVDEGKIRIETSIINLDGELLVPPKTVPFKLPYAQNLKAEITPEAMDELYQMMHKYLRGFWLWDQEDYDVLIVWTMLTYMHEQTDVYPQLWFYGPQGSGKTKLMEYLNEIVYRSSFGKSTVAALAHEADVAKITLLMDETEGMHLNEDLWNLILTRYREGQYYKLMNKDANQLIYKKTWGFSAFAGRNRPFEPLGSRCLIFNIKRLLESPKDIDYELAQKIVDTLYSLKIASVPPSPQIIHSISQNIYTGDTRTLTSYSTHQRIINNNMEYGKLLSYNFDRIDEITMPLITIVDSLFPVTIVSQVSLALADYIVKRKREQGGEESEMLEVDIIEAIDFLLLTNDKIYVKELNKQINEGRDDKEKFTSDRIGRLMKRLGYEKNKSHKDARAWIIDPKIHEYNRKRFNLTDDEEESEVLKTPPEKPKDPQETLAP